MPAPSNEDDKDLQLTPAGCLLAAISVGVICAVAVPVVTGRDPESGRPLPRMVAILIPVLVGALFNGIGTGILKVLGLRVFAKQKSVDHPSEASAPRADIE